MFISIVATKNYNRGESALVEVRNEVENIAKKILIKSNICYYILNKIHNHKKVAKYIN